MPLQTVKSYRGVPPAGDSDHVQNGKFAPKMKKKTAAEGEDLPVIKLNIFVDRWRFRAYLAFWFMVFFAITIQRTLVRPLLLQGPEGDSICGPFNREDPDFGVFYGDGFDVLTHSHLEMLFGFSNICVNWDYSPSRELTAMFYPAFEYLLLIYLVFDFIALILSNKRGELRPWFWYFSCIVFPINVFLCSQFRMIFVCIAYENVKQHTAAFLGLQMALILVAIQNCGYIYDADIAYGLFGGETYQERLKRTRIMLVIYLILILGISIPKLMSTIYVVQHGVGAQWMLNKSGVFDWVVGETIDRVWMLLCAILPVFVAWYRARNEEPLEITISQDQFYVVDEDDAGGEGTNLSEGSPLLATS